MRVTNTYLTLLINSDSSYVERVILFVLLVEDQSIGVFTSTGVTGYKGIKVTFCNAFKWRKVTLIPLYPVTPVLVNTPYVLNQL